jgi:hypothetical protein
MAEDDLRQYLNDPIAAISPAIVAALPPHRHHPGALPRKGQRQGRRRVTFERPARNPPDSLLARETGGMTVLALGIKDIEVADYHYQFYNALAGAAGGPLAPECRSASTAPSARS